jgi:imidazolonepropionase-like amidohydrolase
LGAASAVPTRFAFGQTPPVTLPARGEVLIRGGHVMTMDASTGDVAHVRNGAIVAVGRGLAVPGAEVIDADGMIVLPGLVETPLAHVEHAVAQHGDR